MFFLIVLFFRWYNHKHLCHRFKRPSHNSEPSDLRHWQSFRGEKCRIPAHKLLQCCHAVYYHRVVTFPCCTDSRNSTTFSQLTHLLSTVRHWTFLTTTESHCTTQGSTVYRFRVCRKGDVGDDILTHLSNIFFQGPVSKGSGRGEGNLSDCSISQ